MTKKVYRSAMGKPVDMGALLLQNENTRAVGNMNVNARGDVLDSVNRVIEKKSQQVKRQYRRQTNVSNTPVTKSVRDLKPKIEEVQDTFDDLPSDNDVVAETVQETIAEPASPVRGGLAAAIAKSRTVQQELEKPLNTKPTTLKRI